MWEYFGGYLEEILLGFYFYRSGNFSWGMFWGNFPEWMFFCLQINLSSGKAGGIMINSAPAELKNRARFIHNFCK